MLLLLRSKEQYIKYRRVIYVVFIKPKEREGIMPNLKGFTLS